MMEKQQTAVEWLYHKLQSECLIDMADDIFEHAKQMEREQIEECGRVMYNNGAVDSILKPSDYYTQKYGE